MRFLVAILLALAGLASIAYAYAGVFYDKARRVAAAQTPDEGVRGVMEILDMLMAGAFPMLTNFLYLGALLVVLAIMTALGVFSGRRAREKPAEQAERVE